MLSPRIQDIRSRMHFSELKAQEQVSSTTPDHDNSSSCGAVPWKTAPSSTIRTLYIPNYYHKRTKNCDIHENQRNTWFAT
eukprot:m.1117790 g.1117790  ORF g.1117790 m.1117790 type:complete len:80 (-) comp24380_c0_seq28:8653-8892(-)